MRNSTSRGIEVYGGTIEKCIIYNCGYALSLSLTGSDPIISQNLMFNYTDLMYISTPPEFIFWDQNVLGIEGDGDGDGISDHDEYFIYGTDRLLIDTDMDSYHDGYEILLEFDPLDNLSPAVGDVDFTAVWDALDGNMTEVWTAINDLSVPVDFTEVWAALDGNMTEVWDAINAIPITADFTEVWAALDGNMTEVWDVVNVLSVPVDLTEIWAVLDGNMTEVWDVIDLLGISVGDTDSDGLDDLAELELGTDINCIDTDCDNLNDAFEVKIGTNPLIDDTDGDGYYDGIEVQSASDPLDPNDYPGLGEDEPSEILKYFLISLGALAFIGIFIFGTKKLQKK